MAFELKTSSLRFQKLLVALLGALSGCWLAWFSEADGADPYQGLDDPKVVQVLKSIYGKPGRWNVPPEDGRFLYDLVIKHGLKRGLEIGTSNGYSALWLGLAFRKTGGKLITMEIDQERAREARQNFQDAGLTDVIELKIGDAFKIIPTLAGEFDFVFLDAWKEDYKKFLDLVYPRVKRGGVITAHNVISHADGMRDFLDAILSHPGLQSRIHRTSSAGISVSYKK